MGIRERRGGLRHQIFRKIAYKLCQDKERIALAPQRAYCVCKMSWATWIHPHAHATLSILCYFYITFSPFSQSSMHLLTCSSDPHFMLLLRTFYLDMPSLTSPRSSNSFLFLIYLFLYFKSFLKKKLESFFYFFLCFNFFIFSNYFNVLMLEINFKK